MSASNLQDGLTIDRASRIAERKASGVTAADEPLVIDLVSPIQGFHWTVYQLCASGWFAARQPAAQLQASSGLYLVPTSAPVESLADAQDATFGMNKSARGIRLPYVFVATRAGAGGNFNVFYYAQLFAELIVPTGMMLRFIANVQPGTATPGPGANSQIDLVAHVIEEANGCPAAPRRV